jgi:hypothetical protein
MHLGVALAACFAMTAAASPIQLGFNGDAEISGSNISFGQYPNGAPYAPAPGYGKYEVSLVNPGLFQDAGVTTGEFGNIQSLNAVTTPVGTKLNPTPGSSLPFMTFDTGGSNLQLFLTELVAGTSGPFTLIDTSFGAVAAFNVDGFIYNTTTMQETNFTGTFSATFDGMTVNELEASSSVDTPFSGTLALTLAPEPSSMGLLGGALLAFGFVARRRHAKRSV